MDESNKYNFPEKWPSISGMGSRTGITDDFRDEDPDSFSEGASNTRESASHRFSSETKTRQARPHSRRPASPNSEKHSRRSHEGQADRRFSSDKGNFAAASHNSASVDGSTSVDRRSASGRRNSSPVMKRSASGSANKRPGSSGRRDFSANDSRRSSADKRNVRTVSRSRKSSASSGNVLSSVFVRRPENASAKTRSISRFLFFPVIFLYDEIVLRIVNGNDLFSHPISLLIFILGISAFCTFITMPFKPKVNRLIAEIILWFSAIFFAAESIVKSVYTTYMKLSNLLSGAGNVAGNYGGQLIRSILFGIPKILLFLLPVLVFLRFGKSWISMKKERVPQFAAALACSVILTAAGSFIVKNGSNSAVYGAQFDYNTATRYFGLITSTRLSLIYDLFGNNNNTFHTESTVKSADMNAAAVADMNHLNEDGTSAEYTDSNSSVEETAAEETVITGDNIMDLDLEAVAYDGSSTVQSLCDYISSQTASNKNEYTGLFEGKNLIMVTAESYTNAFISEELTPALWRLSHNGFYFSDYYQPEWGGSTTSGEVSILTGLAPRDGDEAMISLIGHNNYFTMANQMQRLDYSTCAFHNGYYQYYQRDETHPNLGFSQFIADQTGLMDIVGCEYCHDADMIDATVDYYIDKEPFCIYYMTISGHATYDADSAYVSMYYDRVNEVVGDQYEEKTKYYICYQMAMETAMEHLLAKLEEAGIADDTVICLVGDHFPYGLGDGEAWENDQNYLYDLMGTEVSYSWNEDRNGLIIWSGCLETTEKDKWTEIDTPTFSLDILPTLSNLFGLEFDSRLLPGRDVFSDADPLVFWNNLCWVTERGKYSSLEETFYPNDGYSDDSSYVESINNIVENKLLMSRQIEDTDFYALLFGEDTVTSSGQKVFTYYDDLGTSDSE